MPRTITIRTVRCHKCNDGNGKLKLVAAKPKEPPREHHYPCDRCSGGGDITIIEAVETTQ